MAVAGMAALAAFLSCSEPQPEGGLAPSVVVDPSAIQVVGTSEAIARIEDLMPVADGAAWVLNNTEPYLILLSAAGEELLTMGANGAGPGEFSWPSTFVSEPRSGDLWVYDAAPGRLIRVSDESSGAESVWLGGDAGDGERLNTYDYLWMNNGGRAWIEATEDGFVFARPPPGLPWLRSLWSTEVVRLRDGQLEHLVETEGVLGLPSERFGGANRFLPYPIWAGCTDGSLAVYDPNDNVLRRLTEMGESLSVHDLPPRRDVAVSVERVVSTVYPGVLRNRLMANPPDPEVLRKMVRRDYERTASEFSPVFPEFVHLECGSDRDLWLQEFDSAGGQMGRGQRWLRVASNGRVQQVEFPKSFRPMQFREDRIWGVHTGAFEVEHVAWTDATGF